MTQKTDPIVPPLSHEELAARKEAEQVEQDRLAQDEALNDIRAEQQMIEGAVDTDESVRRMEELRRQGG